MPSRAKANRSSATGVEEQAAALEALREQPAEAAEAALRKALGQRNNYLVAKAARMAAELRLAGLVPELAEAFARFMPGGGDPAQSKSDPVKTDPQCWAKNDLAKALAAFEYQEHELFLGGMRHRQMEATWGGRTDTAGALRGTCALALVQCREVNGNRLLGWFTELFADPELTVRVNAARAVEQVGSDAAMLLLKLRAELGSDSPELLGTCYGGVLRLEGPSAIPWAAKFLTGADDAAAEAALAIAETRTAAAFEVLKAAFAKADGGGRAAGQASGQGSRQASGQAGSQADPWFRSALLSAIALTRQAAAMDWLLERIRQGGRESAEAREALLRSGPPQWVLERLQGER